MKIWNNIVQSETEPSVKSIWFKNNRLWFYNNGIWDPLTDEIGKAPDLSGYLKRQEFTSFTEDLLTRQGQGRLKQKHFPSVTVQTMPSQNMLNNPIGYSEYDNYMTFMVSIFHNRPLDSSSKNSYSLVTEGGLARAVNKLIVYLNIGSSAEIKAHNQAQLPTDGSLFLTCIGQEGVGTGIFNPHTGGNATITTADGRRIHYKINVDYSVVRVSTYFEHSELFYYQGEIGISDINGTTTTPVVYNITNSVRDSLLKASNFCFDLVVGENRIRVACPCVTIRPTERVWNSPNIEVGNTNWNYVEFTLRKLESGSYQLLMKAR